VYLCTSSWSDFFFNICDLLEQIQSFKRFFFVQQADCKAHMDHAIIARLCFGHIIKAGLAKDSAEVHLRHFEAALFINLNNLSRNTKTHLILAICLPRSRLVPTRDRRRSPALDDVDILENRLRAKVIKFVQEG